MTDHFAIVVVEHALLYPAVLTLRHLAFPIKVPIGSCQCLSHVRSLGLECVEEMVCGDDVGLATFFGFVKTKETDDVGSVGMEVLSSGGPGK